MDRMADRHWHQTPRQSVEMECARRGRQALVDGCCLLLDGDDFDAGLIVALGGPPAQSLLDSGLPEHQRYWLRVWAARGLLWTWEDSALTALLQATRDEHWRVRELAAKIVARHGITAALPAIEALVDDEVPRVCAAAQRALQK
jgi:HEAT repeat protein